MTPATPAMTSHRRVAGRWAFSSTALFAALTQVGSWQILLQKSLMSSGRSDSVTVMRFAVEARDDGAAQAGPRSIFLFILP
jgi:hypothetical protein